MRNYELMVILDPSIDERTVAPMMEKYLAPVAANGGSVENVDVWGKRRLAYDILKRSEGIYVVIDMTTTPEVALEINRRMGIVVGYAPLGDDLDALRGRVKAAAAEIKVLEP